MPELVGRSNVATPEHPVAELIIESILAHEPEERELRWFSEVRRNLDGSPFPHSDLAAADIETYWQMLYDAGYIDLAGVTYYAYQIVNRLPDVAKALGAGFSWIVIDEYQDTSGTQLATLRRIAEASPDTRWLLIGDFNQSIFGFNGVSKTDLVQFGELVEAKLPVLHSSYRCPTSVIEQALRLIPEPKMKSIDATKRGEVIHHVGAITHAVDEFIRLLNERGIDYPHAAVIAPFNSMLATASESLDARNIPWRPQFRIPGETLVAKAVFAVLAYAHHEIPEHLDHAISEVESLLNGLRVHIDQDRIAEVIVGQSPRLGEALSRMGYSEAVAEVASALAELVPNYALARLDDALRLSLRPSLLRGTPLERWGSITLARRVCDHDAMALATIHGAKGLEFAAVMFVGFEKGVIPHQKSNNNDEEIRKVYVAITRSSNLLVYSNRPYRESPLLKVALGV